MDENMRDRRADPVPRPQGEEWAGNGKTFAGKEASSTAAGAAAAAAAEADGDGSEERSGDCSEAGDGGENKKRAKKTKMPREEKVVMPPGGGGGRGRGQDPSECALGRGRQRSLGAGGEEGRRRCVPACLPCPHRSKLGFGDCFSPSCFCLSLYDFCFFSLNSRCVSEGPPLACFRTLDAGPPACAVAACDQYPRGTWSLPVLEHSCGSDRRYVKHALDDA